MVEFMVFEDISTDFDDDAISKVSQVSEENGGEKEKTRPVRNIVIDSDYDEDENEGENEEKKESFRCRTKRRPASKVFKSLTQNFW